MARTHYGWTGANKLLSTVFTDDTKKIGAETRNDIPPMPVGQLWESKDIIYKSRIWVDDITYNTPPGVTTSSIEVGVLYDVVLNAASAATTFTPYVVVAAGGAHTDTPVSDWINPAIHGPAYAPTLEYDTGGPTWVAIPATHACDWVLDYNSGVLNVYNGALPVTATKYRISGYRYIGSTLADIMSTPGLISNMTVTDGTTTVANAVEVDLDPTQFTVTDLGGGVASVALNTVALQYSYVDDITVLAGTYTYNLAHPTKITSAAQYNLMQVYVNGVRYRYGVDYSLAGLTPGPVTITWINPGPNYTIVAGDILSIVY